MKYRTTFEVETSCGIDDERTKICPMEGLSEESIKPSIASDTQLYKNSIIFLILNLVTIYVHADNKKENILMLGKGPTGGLYDQWISENSFNFAE